MKSVFLPIILLLLIISVAITGSEKSDKNISSQLAVLDFNSVGLSPEQAREATQALRSALENEQNHPVYNPDKMFVIMGQKGYAREIVCTDDSCIIELGGVLGVETMVSGVVGKVSDIFSLSLWMLDVTTGKVLTTIMENYRCEYGEFLDSKIPDVASRIVNTLKILETRAAGPFKLISFDSGFPVMV